MNFNLYLFLFVAVIFFDIGADVSWIHPQDRSSTLDALGPAAHVFGAHLVPPYERPLYRRHGAHFNPSRAKIQSRFLLGRYFCFFCASKYLFKSSWQVWIVEHFSAFHLPIEGKRGKKRWNSWWLHIVGLCTRKKSRSVRLSGTFTKASFDNIIHGKLQVLLLQFLWRVKGDIRMRSMGPESCKIGRSIHPRKNR